MGCRVSRIFGRVGRPVRDLWLRLESPEQPRDGWREELLAAAVNSGAVLDLSHQTALWGGDLHAAQNEVMVTGGRELERSQDRADAMSRMQEEMLQHLCAIGKPCIDFYFLRVARALEEFQIDAALEVLETARAERHIRHLCLSPEGPPLAVLSVWQFHDAFEGIVLSQQNGAQLAPVAAERNVGVLWDAPTVNTPRRVRVSSAQEVAGLL